MTTTSVTYSWHGAKNNASAFAALCLLVSIYIACIAIFRPHHLSPGRAMAAAIISALFLAAAIGLKFDHRITIDLGAGFVSRTIWFWGTLLWKSRWPLTDFVGVNTYRLKAGPSQSPMDLVYVGLKRVNGSSLAVQYFRTGRNRPCPAADEFAKELGCVIDGKVTA